MKGKIKKSSKNGISKTHMNRLWRKAVLANYHNMCPKCGNTNIEEIQCHHIVYRRHSILLYDWRNGIPGCTGSCHLFYHTKKGEQFIAKIHKYYDYLCDRDNITIKDHLVKKGMTRTEFLLEQKAELEALFKGAKNG